MAITKDMMMGIQKERIADMIAGILLGILLDMNQGITRDITPDMTKATMTEAWNRIIKNMA